MSILLLLLVLCSSISIHLSRNLLVPHIDYRSIYQSPTPLYMYSSPSIYGSGRHPFPYLPFNSLPIYSSKPGVLIWCALSASMHNYICLYMSPSADPPSRLYQHTAISPVLSPFLCSPVTFVPPCLPSRPLAAARCRRERSPTAATDGSYLIT